jgi:uncharacterized protein with PhoU and TrkA domain
MPYEYRPRSNATLWVAIASLAVVILGAALHIYADHEVLAERVMQLEQRVDKLEQDVDQLQRFHGIGPR